MSLERFDARFHVGGRPGWFRNAVRLAGLVAATTAALATIPASSRAGTANAGLPGASKTNPLAGMQWGIYRGPIDGVYPAYQSARGPNRRLMAKIALQPLTIWTGAWYPVNYAQTVAREIVQDTTGGNANLLSQIAVFRLDPVRGWDRKVARGADPPARSPVCVVRGLVSADAVGGLRRW
jgi:hypothetical protein